MAEILYDQVYVDSGTTIQAWVYIETPWGNPPLPNNYTLPVWEPLPFSPIQVSWLKLIYSQTQIDIFAGMLYFRKTITNETTQFDNPSGCTFVFLISPQ